MSRPSTSPGLFDLLLPPDGQGGLARDLEVLLNTRARRVYPPDDLRADDTTAGGFGTPALDLDEVLDAHDRERLVRRIEEQLRRFERRLRDAEVSVEEGAIRICGRVAVRVRDRFTGRVRTKWAAVAFTAARGDRGFTLREDRP